MPSDMTFLRNEFEVEIREIWNSRIPPDRMEIKFGL